MPIEPIVKGFIDGRLEEIAEQIKHDMVSVVSQHSRSGKAVNAIRIEKLSPTSYFIGAHIGSDWRDGGLHLYYLDQGNGGRDKTIYPTRARALGPLPPHKGHPGGYRANVSGYDGIGFVKDIADKYR